MFKHLTSIKNLHIKKIEFLKLKQAKTYNVQKKFIYWRYFRFGYFSRYSFGRRRVKLNRFFFYRASRSLYFHKRSSLVSNFFYFLKYFRHRYLHKFLHTHSFIFAVKFYRRIRANLKHFFFKSYRQHLALRFFFILLLKRRTGLSGNLLSLTNVLNYSKSFLSRKRLRLNLSNFLYARKLKSMHVIKKLIAFSRLRKHRRIGRSLFSLLKRISLNRIFFITLRSSKNNTMLSVFDFLGNLHYWKTSKAVGMAGKKKSTKMAAEFLAYHLTRFLRSKKFYTYKFVFTLFGLHRHFKVVFRFIKRSIRNKNILGMLNKSRVPHGGPYLKKRKHKGRKKYRPRASLYY